MKNKDRATQWLVISLPLGGGQGADRPTQNTPEGLAESEIVARLFALYAKLTEK